MCAWKKKNYDELKNAHTVQISKKITQNTQMSTKLIEILV